MDKLAVADSLSLISLTVSARLWGLDIVVILSVTLGVCGKVQETAFCGGASAGKHEC